MQNTSVNLLYISKFKSVISRLQPELESAAGWNQPQLVVSLVPSCQNSSKPPGHSQPQNKISLKSYPAARTRVSCRIESAATCIQPPELESAVGWNQASLISSRQNLRQSQLVSSNWNSSYLLDRISHNSYSASRTRVSRSCIKPQLYSRYKSGIIKVNFLFLSELSK